MSSSLSSGVDFLGFESYWSGDPDPDLLGEVPEISFSNLIPPSSALNPDFCSRDISSRRLLAFSRCKSVLVTSCFGGVLSGWGRIPSPTDKGANLSLFLMSLKFMPSGEALDDFWALFSSSGEPVGYPVLPDLNLSRICKRIGFFWS